MEITRTQMQKEEADNRNSKFKKVCYGSHGDMLVLTRAILFLTYPGIGYKALNNL